jgi:hypothetical protein
MIEQAFPFQRTDSQVMEKVVDRPERGSGMPGILRCQGTPSQYV